MRYDVELGSFVQSYGGKILDASLLLIPLVGFLPAEDPRVASTVGAIEQRLLRDGLVFRYDSSVAKDGLPPGEGAFLACSFWLADNLVLGRTLRRRWNAEMQVVAKAAQWAENYQAAMVERTGERSLWLPIFHR